MSGNEMIAPIRKKYIDIEDNTDNKLNQKNNINLLNDLKKKEIDEDFMFQCSNELLNENIKLSGILSPFINPIPHFKVKNDNPKREISSRNTFYKVLKTQENPENCKKYENLTSNNDKNLKIKNMMKKNKNLII